MEPTIERIRESAFARWERRGQAHGFDRPDWLAAERQERFARNYRVVLADGLDAASPRAIGSSSRRRCRFCAQSVPRTEFGAPVAIVPNSIGTCGPVAFDHCTECAEAFAEGIDAALTRFARPILDAWGSNPLPCSAIGVDAFKGLVKLGLSLMPVADLDEYEEAIEWVANPDHDFDVNVFRDLACVALIATEPTPAPWVVLAARTEPEEPWPSRLLFLGIGRVVLQVAIPMGQVDEDQDVLTSTLPDVCPPLAFGPSYDLVSRVAIPIRPCLAVPLPTRLSA